MSTYSEPEQWLREAIDSILNQVFGDFEFLIVDDNPDSELNKEVLDEYASTDSRIRIIRNSVNHGLTRSLNIALKEASGSYIARMDADDISQPSRLKKQFDFLEGNLDYALVGSFIEHISQNGRHRRNFRFPVDHDDIVVEIPLANPFNHPTLMIRRSILAKNNIHYDASFRYAQDYALICELSRYGKLHNIPEPLLKYRISQNQISQKSFSIQHKLFIRSRDRFLAMRLLDKYGETVTDWKSALESVENLIAHKGRRSKELTNMWFSLLCYQENLHLVDVFRVIFAPYSISLHNRLKVLYRFLFT